MNTRYAPERVDTLVIGGGQAGLAVGYHLARRGLPFVILDAHHRVGDSWRTRWDSMRLFTPASHDGLPGMRFRAPRTTYPTKDEMADHLEAYAARFRLPVRLGVSVDALAESGDGFVVAAGELRFEADNVVVATPSDLVPWSPPYAAELDPGLVQLHSFNYRNPAQLQEGPVVIVGAGNSGADIAIEVVKEHPTSLSGRHPGHIPFPLSRVTAGLLYPLVRFGFHRVLTVRTPMGRKLHAHLDGHGKPLVRVKPSHLAAAGVDRVPRTVGVRDGLPLVEDGRVLEAANVI